MSGKKVFVFVGEAFDSPPEKIAMGQDKYIDVKEDILSLPNNRIIIDMLLPLVTQG